MDGLGIATSVVAVIQVTTSVIGYLLDVKTASDDRQKCLIEATNVLTLLTNLRIRVEVSTSADPWYNAARTLSLKNGPLEQLKDALDTVARKLNPVLRIKEAGESLYWALLKPDVLSLLDRIERVKTHVQTTLAGDAFKLLCTVKNDTNSLQKDSEVIDRSIDEGYCHEVLNWLCPTDQGQQHGEIVRKRQTGTCTWFLEQQKFHSWLQTPGATLFCPGKPGTGKTFLASTVIDHVQGLSRNDKNIGVAFLYCDYKRRDEQSLCHLISGMIKQLVQNRPALLDLVEPTFNKHKFRKSRPTFDALTELLFSVITSLDHAFIVIDGLDECDQDQRVRERLYQCLIKLQAQTDIRLLCTSRFTHDIVRTVSPSNIIELRASKNDLQGYLESQVQTLSPYVRKDPDLQKWICSRVLDASDGIFLLAKLHLESLKNQRSLPAINLKLDKLRTRGKTLEQAYDETVLRIQRQSEDHSNLAKQTISWIVLSKAALTVIELREALSIEPEVNSIDEDELYELEDIVSACCGLVTIEEDGHQRYVRLAHYSTHEYFVRKIPSWVPDAQKDIALTCLAVMQPDFLGVYAQLDSEWHKNPADLNVEDADEVQAGQVKRFRFKYCDEADMNGKKDALAKLTTHAYTNWIFYVEPFQGDAEVTTLVLNILQETNPSCRRPSQTVCKPGEKFLRTRTGWKTGPSMLLSAIQKGLSSLLVQLIQSRELDVTARDTRRKTPLALAAETGSVGIAEIVLGIEDVDIHAVNDVGNTALHSAVEYGHPEIVKLLVSQPEININIVGIWGNTALHLAARLGSTEIVRVLLSADNIDINATNLDGETALHLATETGSDKVVDCLLQIANIDVNQRSNRGATALALALKQRQIKVVRTLLADPKINLNLADANGCSPLKQAIISCRHADHDSQECSLKEVLARPDVNVAAKDKHDWTALHWSACEQRYGATALLLKRADVDVTAKNAGGRAAWTYAAARGDVELTKLLLRHEGTRDELQDEGYDVMNEEVLVETVIAKWSTESYGLPPLTRKVHFVPGL